VLDKETNLHYNYFRDYGPAEGRYIQADPLGITTTTRPTPTTGLNHLYAYVLNDPLGAVDPLGLLRWKGGYHARGLVGPVGSVLMQFDLTSECVNGQQAQVSVTAVGPAGGIGLRISETYSDVEFEDYQVDIRPTIFNGTFTASSAGVIIGRRGGSIGKMRLGGAYQVGGANTRGIDVGATLATGSSTVTNVDIKDCVCPR
jgi:RHS repeat-associated protein